MRVKLVDPSAFTPPYDRALAAALAAAGAEVELITSRFVYGPVPEPDGYRATLEFYRRATAGNPAGRLRRLAKLAEHGPDMLRLKRRLDRAPAGPAPLVTHYQWLTLPALDRHLISRRRPRVLTAHYVLPAEPSRRDLRRAARLYGSMDAVVAHSRGGADRLAAEAGVPAERIRVIPHGSFEHLTRHTVDAWLPSEFDRPGGDPPPRGPVILFFGLLRPYKGLDVLIEACRELPPVLADGSVPELWIAGNPRMDLTELRAQAERLPIPVRWATRFIKDPEIAQLMRQADLVVLPYRDGEQSGVLYTGIAFGKAMVVSKVGGIGEVAADHGLARLVAPGDSAELAGALSELIADPDARRELEARAGEAARGPFAWPQIAAETLRLYRELTA